MKNMRRRLARCVIPTGVLLCGWHMYARAAGLATYANANAKNGYSFHYPSRWINKPASGEDFDIFSPDNNTLLEGGAVRTAKGDTLAKLRATFVNGLKIRKAEAGTIKAGMANAHGQNFATITGVVPINGTEFQTIIWVTQRAGKSYVFDGVWGLGQPKTHAEQIVVMAWLNSITLKTA